MGVFSFRALSLGLIASVALVACGGGGGESSVLADSSTSPDTFLVGVVAAMNDVHSRVPASFYQLDTDTVNDHEYFHVRSNDVWSTATVSYDLATQDANEALNWQSQKVLQQYPLATLVSSSDNAWYYESVWQSDDPYTHSHVISARVYKSTKIDRSVHDAYQPAALQAVLTTPVSASDASWISEYLWSFSSCNNTGHVVANSTTVTTDSGYRHSITEAVYDEQASADGCVNVELWNHDYDINQHNGSVTLNHRYQRSFQAQRTANGYTLCSSTATSSSAGMTQTYAQ